MAATLTGTGQSLGLLEYYGTDLADLQTYYTNAKQTYPGSVITLLSTDGTSTSCVDTKSGGDCDDTEQTLDMTQALGMAPGLSKPDRCLWARPTPRSSTPWPRTNRPDAMCAQLSLLMDLVPGGSEHRQSLL